jgi:alpha-mannosidase
MAARRIAVLGAEGDSAFIPGVVYKLLHHPILIGALDVEIDLRRNGRASDSELQPLRPDASLHSYDLIVVPQGEMQPLDEEASAWLAGYLRNGGALVATQLVTPDDTLPEELLGELGLRAEQWADPTPSHSLLARHGWTRPLGVSPGQSVYPHRPYWRHARIVPEGADVLTTLGPAPDLVLSRDLPAALFATDVFHDLLRHREHPDYAAFERNLGLLLANVVRGLLAEPLTEPVSDAISWSALRCHALAVGRLFVDSLHGELGLHEPGEVARAALVRAAACARECARRGLAGDRAGADEAFGNGARALALAVDEVLTGRRFLVRGWHGGIVFDRQTPSGLLGYAEFGWPDWIMRWVDERVAWTQRYGIGQVNDISPACWEVLAPVYPAAVERLAAACREGRVETVRGAYSHAYLEICGPESNIRQFEHGLESVSRILGGAVRTFMCAADHYDFHPQLPQILRGFGFDYAVLRCGGPGEIAGVDEEKLLWQGLDGTTIEAVPTYASVPTRPYWEAAEIAAAERAGLTDVLLGGAHDATRLHYWEEEDALVNGRAPVAGTITTPTAFFEQTPTAERARYFGVDELRGRPQWWSGFSQVNGSYRVTQALERQLVAAERFDAVAQLHGAPAQTGRLRHAWKRLLVTQDHFTFGCGGPLNPDGFNTGSMHDPHVAQYPGPKTPIPCDDVTTDYRAECDEIGSEVLAGALRVLAGRIEVSEAGVGSLAVFNPLGWSRRAIVTAQLPLEDGQAGTVHAAVAGERLPSQTNAERRHPDGSLASGELVFACDLPAFGYQMVELLPAEAEVPDEGAAAPTVLESDRFVVELDAAHGAVARIRDKELGADLLAPGSVGNRLYCAGPPVLDSTRSPALIETLETGPVRQRRRVAGTIGGCPYTCDVVLHAGSARIDFDLEIDFGAGQLFGRKMDEATALRVVFPLALRDRREVSQPFGVYPSENAFQVATDFVDVGDETRGVALFHDSTPAVYADDLGVSFVLADGFPPIRGVHRFRYALYSHTGRCVDSDVYRAAQEYLAEPVTVPLEPRRGRLPGATSFVDGLPDNVSLSALYVDGGEATLRLHETSGRKTAVALRLAFPWPRHARLVTLDGRAEGAADVREGVLHLELAPWRIATLRFPVVSANGGAPS